MPILEAVYYFAIIAIFTPDLDSRLAYPRPRPRLSIFKTKTNIKTLMSKTKTETQDLPYKTNTGSL